MKEKVSKSSAAKSEEGPFAEFEFREIAENIPHTVWITDANGRNGYQNKAWYEFVGAGAGSSFGEDWLEFYHPDDRSFLLQEWTKARASKGAYPYDIEARLRRHDGTYHRFRIVGKPVHDQRGEVVRWVGTCTQLDSAGASSREGPHRVGVFEWDMRTGKIRRENPAYLEILGGSQAETGPFEEGALFRAMQRNSRTALKKALEAAMQTRSAVRIAVQLHSHGRSFRTVDIAGAFQYDASGDATTFLGTMIELTPSAPGKHDIRGSSRSGLANWQVTRVIQHMGDHIDQDFRLQQLASLASLSPFHFLRAFKRSVGVPPGRYFKSLRVEKARDLLRDTDTSLSRIASAVGYDSVQALSRAFKQKFGTTPSSYRRKAKR